jgi:hypothetical protein
MHQVDRPPELVDTWTVPRFSRGQKVFFFLCCLIAACTLAVAVPLARPTALLWLNQMNGAKVYVPPTTSGGRATLLIASSSPDGKWVLTANRVLRGKWLDIYDSQIILWEASTQTKKWSAVLSGEGVALLDREVDHVFWSPDSTRLVVTDGPDIATIFDITDGSTERQIKNIEGYSAASTSEGLWVFRSRNKKTAIDVYSWTDFGIMRHVDITGIGDTLSSVNANSINLKKQIWARAVQNLAESTDVAIRLENLQPTNKNGFLGILHKPGSRAFSHAFHPNGTWLAVSYIDGSLGLWNTETKKLIWQSQRTGEFDLARGIQWNPSGTAFVIFSAGSCGWMRSNCVSVVWPGTDGTKTVQKVVWNHNFSWNHPAQWIDDNHLLIGTNSRAFTLKVQPPSASLFN